MTEVRVDGVTYEVVWNGRVEPLPMPPGFEESCAESAVIGDTGIASLARACAESRSRFVLDDIVEAVRQRMPGSPRKAVKSGVASAVRRLHLQGRLRVVGTLEGKYNASRVYAWGVEDV